MKNSKVTSTVLKSLVLLMIVSSYVHADPSASSDTSTNSSAGSNASDTGWESSGWRRFWDPKQQQQGANQGGTPPQMQQNPQDQGQGSQTSPMQVKGDATVDPGHKPTQTSSNSTPNNPNPTTTTTANPVNVPVRPTKNQTSTVNTAPVNGTSTTTPQSNGGKAQTSRVNAAPVNAPTSTANTAPVSNNGGKSQTTPVVSAPVNTTPVSTTNNTSAAAAAAPAVTTPVTIPTSGKQLSEDDKIQSPSLDAKIEPMPVPELKLGNSAKTFGGNMPANPVEAGSCEDKAMAELYDLLLKDNNNALGIMYELTAQRIARRALEQNPDVTNLESLTYNNIDILEKQLSSVDSNKDIQKSVQKIYNDYGRATDESKVNDVIKSDLVAAKEKAKNACYYNKSTQQRFSQNETSAFVLAVVTGEGSKSGLSEIDVATMWVVEHARQSAEAKDPAHYAIGKANGNLLNISTRVARYLGRIVGGRNVTKEDMDKIIADQEKSLKTALQSVFDQTKVSLDKCMAAQTKKDCPDCAQHSKERLDVFSSKNLDIEAVQKGLLQKIAQMQNKGEEELKIEKALKAKMGHVQYDFSNFAVGTAKDKIAHRSPRDVKDPCMENYWAKKGKKGGDGSVTVTADAQAPLSTEDSHISAIIGDDSAPAVKPVPGAIAATQPSTPVAPVKPVPATTKVVVHATDGDDNQAAGADHGQKSVPKLPPPPAHAKNSKPSPSTPVNTNRVPTSNGSSPQDLTLQAAQKNPNITINFGKKCTVIYSDKTNHYQFDGVGQSFAIDNDVSNEDSVSQFSTQYPTFYNKCMGK